MSSKINTRYNSNRKSKRSISKKLLALGIVLVIIAVIAVLELTNTTHLLHSSSDTADNRAPTTGGAATKGQTASTGKTDTTKPTTSTSTTTTQPGANKQGSNSISGTLTAPTGTFVNVYNARLSDTLGSTCNTSPGATCQITFTSGSTSQSLPAKTSDSGGAVYWYWKPADVGLTAGSWHITAVATAGSQTKTTDNGSLTLELTQ